MLNRPRFSDAALSKSLDKTVREENRRAIAGEPTLAETDPFLADFFNMTLEEIREEREHRHAMEAQYDG